MSTASYDLTTVSGVHAYLTDTIFASHTVTSFSGGTANFTYRIHLNTPLKGQETLVLKHGQPYIKALNTIPFSLDRQTFEYEAMTRVKSWLPADSLVTVPNIYKFDNVQHVIIMEDCGESALTLKEFTLQGRFRSVDMAEAIGTSLGSFLSGLHKWSCSNPDGLLDMFAKNAQAFQMSAWAFYGRLVQTLQPGEDDSVPCALTDPPLTVSEMDLGVIKRVAEETSSAMLVARNIFVMGDFWPGNVMVALDSKEQLQRLYILDWELAKPGLPGVEIGQFCAEMHLLRRFDLATEQYSSAVLTSFLKAYALGSGYDNDVARRALVHLGTHLVVLTPRVSWGDKDSTRKVVEEGVQLIVAASDATEKYLSKSLVQPLVAQDWIG